MMSDNGSSLSRRSSSQTSRASNENNKTKTLRGAPKRAGSKTSVTSPRILDPSLTSFPSFSPEPDTKVEPKRSKVPVVARTISQKARERKATLAGLTSGSPAFGHQNALFDDSPRSSLDVPGSLHLASDEHISRLVARTGAVKLVRQYAQDLAQRDAEISKLRVRADDRERELKRLLKAADVTSADIEKALMRLEQGERHVSQEQSRSSMDGLMSDAIATEMALSPVKAFNEMGQSVAAHRSAPSLSQAGKKASTVSSRHGTRTNSQASVGSEDLEATLRPRVSSSNTNKLQTIFQPPPQSTSYFIGGKPVKKQKAADEVSVRSNQSSKSFASWTQIFGGRTQTGRARATSLDMDTTSAPPQSEAESALAKLAKIKTQPASIRGSSNSASTNTLKAKPTGHRTPTTSRLSSSPSHVRKDSNASLPLTVELDSVLQPDTLPPTMTTNKADPSGVLTDRFGFIYDQRRRKRQSLSIPKAKRNRLSGMEASSLRAASPPKDPIDRSSTPMSIDEDSQKKPWQDYLKPSLNISAGRPKELLLHTPSATAVVTVNTADVEGTITPPRRARGASVSATDQGLQPSMTSMSNPQGTMATATSSENINDESDDLIVDSTPSKLLLDQLNELHDSLQSERMVKWNDFLRRVRADRASNADPSSNNAPEADLLDGELIGVASLGLSAKQRAKYNLFKSLVLAGVPVQLRPKVWSEASGASERRVPGYYEDLVMRSDEGTDIDPDIEIQIKADIRRTLTDNVFFQTGPGVKRLEEVLRAYSLHNPSIGYCQGMNLITASLLLICGTAEDCFWLLITVIDTILPSGYFSGSLLTARADQIVLREYVTQLLPVLSAKLDELGVELEACTFHWFLSLYAGVLTGGEALYRIWDIVLTLHSTDATPNFTGESRNLGVDFSTLNLSTPATPVTATNPTAPSNSDAESSGNPNGTASPEPGSHDGTSSPFLFQIALSLLFLNQTQIMNLESAAQVYTFINHNMTDHGVSLDSLIRAAEALGGKIKRAEVLERRERARRSLGG